MEQQVLDIVWFVIWGLVILAGVGVVLWLVVFIVGVLGFRNFDKKIDRDFGKRKF